MTAKPAQPNKPKKKPSDTDAEQRPSVEPDAKPDASEAFRQTRKDHAQERAEDYVELIDELIRTKGEARLVDIARRLGVSHVTANQAVGRLQQKGLVHKEPYRAVFLTDVGTKLAQEVRSRHETVFEFLTSIGVPAAQAQIDAEGIEHHISQVTLKVMDDFLKNKKVPSLKMPSRTSASSAQGNMNEAH